jgi:hypothetical protein
MEVSRVKGNVVQELSNAKRQRAVSGMRNHHWLAPRVREENATFSRKKILVGVG